MTTKRTPLLGLAAALAVLLAGCSMSSPTPQPITDAEMESYLQARVDAAWANTGLDGVVERPESGTSSLVSRLTGIESEGMSNCMEGFGVEAYAWSDVNGGPHVEQSDEKSVTPELRLQFFECFERHPTFDFSGAIFSPDEIDYLYNYYQRQVVPCLRVSGFEVRDVPTREQFEGRAGQWSPYFGIPGGFGSTKDFDGIVKKCGDPYLALNVEPPFGR